MPIFAIVTPDVVVREWFACMEAARRDYLRFWGLPPEPQRPALPFTPPAE